MRTDPTTTPRAPRPGAPESSFCRYCGERIRWHEHARYTDCGPGLWLDADVAPHICAESPAGEWLHVPQPVSTADRALRLTRQEWGWPEAPDEMVRSSLGYTTTLLRLEVENLWAEFTRAPRLSVRWAAAAALGLVYVQRQRAAIRRWWHARVPSDERRRPDA